MTRWVNAPALYFAMRRLGIPGVVTAVCLVTSAALIVACMAQRRTALDAADAQLVEARRELSKARRHVNAEGTATPQATYKAVVEALPTVKDFPGRLAQVRHTANQHELALDASDYVLVKSAEGPTNYYRMTFPLHGRYPDIRNFLSEVLRTMPYVALEGLNVSRQNVAQGEVEAKVTLLFFMKRDK